MKKMTDRLIPGLLMVVFLFALVSCSGSENPQGSSAAQPDEKTAVAQNPPAESQQPQAAGEMGKNEQSQSSEMTEKSAETMQPATSETAEITGTVMLSDAGVVIETDNGNFGVTGQDLTDLAGKTVSIIGTLEESDGRKMIEVISVVEVK